MKFFFIVFLLSTAVFASSGSLANKKTWLMLLHFDGDKSSIINRDFFISKDGYKDSQSELKATLYAFRENRLICKYPARYVWLSKYYKELKPDKLLACKNLQNWKLFKKLKSISLVFVSGFLGNPASAFGHSFLKINQYKKESELFDVTISYGAILPKKNNIFLYIINGITGGYKASYSDKYYYMDNMVYSNQEYREMWEYKLKLSDKQKRFLLYHLWELKGIHFKYYFFNRNCGYKITELLASTYNKDVLPKANIWFAPIESFYRLEKLGLVNDVIYHPSKQQEIYAFYDSLSKDEKNIVVKKIKDKNYDYIKNDENISQEKIYDFLISYQKYTNNNADLKLLLKRLKLPKSTYKTPKPKEKEAVTNGNKMSYIGAGFDRFDKKNYTTLSFSAFSLDKVGFNSLDGDMLSILDTKIWLSDKVKLKSLDFIKVRRLKINRLPFDKESPISWELRVGLDNRFERDYFAEGGVGYTTKYKSLKLYALLDASLHSKKDKIKVRPKIGCYANLDKLRVNIELGSTYNEKFQLLDKDYLEALVEYSFQKQKSIYLNINHDYKSSISAGFKWFY